MKTQYKKDKVEIGIDESGLGPLFGRVYAGAVCWDPDVDPGSIKDSKKFYSRKAREKRSFTSPTGWTRFYTFVIE